MSAQLQIFEADGTTPASPADWGTVRPGNTSATLTRVVKNVGDAPALAVELGFSEVGTADLETWVTGTVAGEPFTYTSPRRVGDLAVGAQLSVTLTAVVPAGADPTSALLAALLYADWE